ncbi:hypothetical protein HDV00_008791 [Rhizophlyctis rosea]|nr:hypothetical protein HDV00_008791 [Rhizophlyctis rosea]
MSKVSPAAAAALNPPPTNPQEGASLLKDVEMGKTEKLMQVADDLNLSQFIPAQEANAYSSIKSATNGVVSNLSLYIGLLIAAFSPGGRQDPIIITLSIAAFITSSLAIILSCYLFSLSPKAGDKSTPGGFSLKARRINNTIAILSPVSLILNMAISSLIGKGDIRVAGM